MVGLSHFLYISYSVQRKWVRAAVAMSAAATAISWAQLGAARCQTHDAAMFSFTRE